MNIPIYRSMLLLLIVITQVVIGGCQQRGSDESAVTDTMSADEPRSQTDAKEGNPNAATKDKRNVVAAKAKDALLDQLSARLVQVLQMQGPVAAIDVCSQEAVKIADAVGKEHGVQIGRTSFKLRNPANAPRDWVRPFVAKRVDTPQHIQLDNGNLGALYPIHLNVKCLMCHGQTDEILDAVKPELAKRYPNDAATGFKQGELRGWFWVEVPPIATTLSLKPTS